MSIMKTSSKRGNIYYNNNSSSSSYHGRSRTPLAFSSRTKFRSSHSCSDNSNNNNNNSQPHSPYPSPSRRRRRNYHDISKPCKQHQAEEGESILTTTTTFLAAKKQKRIQRILNYRNNHSNSNSSSSSSSFGTNTSGNSSSSSNCNNTGSNSSDSNNSSSVSYNDDDSLKLPQPRPGFPSPSHLRSHAYTCHHHHHRYRRNASGGNGFTSYVHSSGASNFASGNTGGSSTPYHFKNNSKCSNSRIKTTQLQSQPQPPMSSGGGDSHQKKSSNVCQSANISSVGHYELSNDNGCNLIDTNNSLALAVPTMTSDADSLATSVIFSTEASPLFCSRKDAADASLLEPCLSQITPPSETNTQPMTEVPDRPETKRFKLETGAFVVPHPAKAYKGGEDAHFVTPNAIGVADGVGGWADSGVDPALYANKLMEGAKLAALKQNDPSVILHEAYEYASNVVGSSTACIICVEENKLKAANLGDSGFLIIRDCKLYNRSKEQQHSFNFPFQLGTGSTSFPQHADLYEVPVEEGDIIIAGSDGLFDNVFTEEIIDICKQEEFARNPNLLAQEIALTASRFAHQASRLSPFAIGAQQANLYFMGGKVDDVTVVVGRVAHDQ